MSIIQERPSVVFISLALLGTLTPWLILIVLGDKPYSDIEYDWILQAWFVWSLPFFFLGLFSWRLLHNARTTAEYRNVYVFIGYVVITNWIVMVILFHEAWTGYGWYSLGGIGYWLDLSKRIANASKYHALLTLLALFAGLFFMLASNAFTGNEDKGLKLLRNGNVPLVASFWEYGVIVNIFFFIVLLLTDTILCLFAPISTIYYLPFVVLYFMFLYTVVLGVWKSSSNYKGPLIWVGIADFVILALALGSVLFLMYSSIWFFQLFVGIRQFSM